MLSRMNPFLIVALIFAFAACQQQEIPQEKPPAAPSFSGRWDVTVNTEADNYPSWFEIEEGTDGLKGRFTGQFGNARPISQITVDGNRLKFSLPKQYEKRDSDLVFEGALSGDRIEGTTTGNDGNALQWTAVRAPALKRTGPVEWGESIALFNGKDISGWRLRNPDGPNGWKVTNRILVNEPPSTDLMTEQQFKDFKLHLEFKIPEKGNSGVYLRGRYEVQIEDGAGKEPSSTGIGGVYGFLTPTTNAAKKPGEWQSYDITLVGRKLTVVLNGTTILENQEIPGLTGGALNSDEGEPGPIFLQGDHSAVSYRNILITSAK